MLLGELQQLLERPKEDYFKEMYRTKSTFGITTAVNYGRVVSFIDGELGNMHWYSDNGYEKVAQAVPGYIVGYCLFNYAVPRPCKALFHMYYQIMEQAYFDDLGFVTFRTGDGVFEQKKIKKAIKKLLSTYNKEYPQLSPNVSVLNFQSPTSFTRSYMKMIEDLDLTKA